MQVFLRIRPTPDTSTPAQIQANPDGVSVRLCETDDSTGPRTPLSELRHNAPRAEPTK